jgi:hypothetical protein
MSSKQPKTTIPSDADLNGNPLIGGSKGVTASQSTPDDLEDSEGENTIEGDVGNDVNAQGGVDKPQARKSRPDR